MADGQEAGVTAFQTQSANLQLGVVRVNEQLNFRFNVSGQVKDSTVPTEWLGKAVRMEIKIKPTKYTSRLYQRATRRRRLSSARRRRSC
jgi:hypothetical protein